jgi:hypothetical protein
MRHYSRRTEGTSVHWIRRFIVFHQKRHPQTMGASEITAFLSWLATSQPENRCGRRRSLPPCHSEARRRIEALRTKP